MKNQSPADQAAEAMAAALTDVAARNPHLKEVQQSFRALLIEQARWKAELSASGDEASVSANLTQHGKGVPLTTRDQLTRLGSEWQIAVERLMTALVAGFPQVQKELKQLREAVVAGRFAPDEFLSAVFGGRDKDAWQLAGQIGLNLDIAAFALTQVAKPVVEKRAEALRPLIKDLSWDRGLCPVCGSHPELSLLREKEGQRWLRCGFCSSMWRFQRTCCPSCEAQEPSGIELIYVEGREHERIEACTQCKKYIPGIDLRSLVDEVVFEVARFILMPLEVIAQERGFLPLGGSNLSLH